MNASSRKAISIFVNEADATTPDARTTNPRLLKPLVGGVDCRFFKLGSCRYGDRCRFRHARADGEWADEDAIAAKAEQDENKNEAKPENSSPDQTHTRELGGAFVTFGPGAEVIDVKPGEKPGRLQLCSVSCAWYPPSKTACLEFRSLEYMEEASRRLSDCTVLDRKIQWRAVVDKNVRPWLILLKLGNLHVSTTERMLRGVCNIAQPRQVTFGEASYSSSATEIGASLQWLFAAIGTVRNWSMAPPNSKSPQCKATAIFSTPEEATKAVRQFNGYKLPRLCGSRVFLSRYIKAKYSILTLLYDVVAADLRQVARKFHSRSYLDVKCYEDNTNKTQASTIVHVVGNMANDVRKAKAAVEKILGGHTARSGRATLWDMSFLKPEGKAFLKNLGNQHNVFIYRDAINRLLRLYGSNQDVAKVESALTKAVEDINASETKIALRVQVPTACYHAGYLRIVGKLGKGSTRLNLTTSPKTLTILGTPEDVDWAETVLLEESNREMKSDYEDENQSTCVVCWCNISDLYITPCGHLYDRDCFVDQCLCAGDTDIPITCLGSTGDCREIIPFAELEANLTRDQLDKVLENSFAGYVRTHPRNYQYCPTAGCDQVHQLDAYAREQVLTCTTCLTSLCTSCGNVSHEGFSCKQYKSTLVGDEDFAEWKRQNSAKDCPECGCPIQKSEGCNHMQCMICKAHMCWLCLKIFTTESKTYDHMSEEHGGDYDEDSDDEFDDENGDDEWSDYEDDGYESVDG